MMTVKDIRDQLKGVPGNKPIVVTLNMAGVDLPCEVREIATGRYAAIINVLVPMDDVLEESLVDLQDAIEKKLEEFN